MVTLIGMPGVVGKLREQLAGETSRHFFQCEIGHPRHLLRLHAGATGLWRGSQYFRRDHSELLKLLTNFVTRSFARRW